MLKKTGLPFFVFKMPKCQIDDLLNQAIQERVEWDLERERERERER